MGASSRSKMYNQDEIKVNFVNIPAFICALMVNSYWLIVFIKTILIRPKIGKTPNIIPKEIEGFISRLFMLPLLVSWNYLPWKAAFYVLPSHLLLAYIGALVTIIALVLSLYCWHYMGTSWRIGIDPGEKTKLLTSGPFHYIRHPIYTLSMLLMLGSFLSIQTNTMFMLLCLHLIIFGFEALREERYLQKIHGASYQKYKQYTGRFLPLLFK